MRRASPALVALALAAVAALAGAACATDDAATRAPFPALETGRAVAVLAIRNDTGDALRFERGDVVARVGGQRPHGASVPESLRALAHEELARRGVPLLPLASVDRAVPSSPPDAAAAIEAARRAAFPGPVLWIRLSRWNVSRTGFLVAWLDLALLDPATGRTLWRGATRSPIAVRNAPTLADVVVAAAPALLGEALGDH